MDTSHKYAGLDTFKIICALVVVGVHTYPLMVINNELNFAVFHILARVAVPFFFMVTGYFIIPKMLNQKSNTDKTALPVSFLKKTSLIYVGASLLYLPVSIYAGYFSGNIIASILRNIIFDGMFYHLWYLPASIIGIMLIYLLSFKFSLRTILGISVLLYVIGLFGDSYYGLVSGVPVLETLYSAGFQIFSYTRNGIFLAPVFLAMGGFIAGSQQNRNWKINITGFIMSMLIMLAEGILLFINGIPRHDSMYIFLLPCMYYLFCTLLQWHGHPRPLLREISLYIYIFHPIITIALRGGVKFAGLNNLLVSNNMIHFIIVCLLSILLSTAIIKTYKRIKYNRL